MNDGCEIMSVSGPLRGAAVCDDGCKIMSVYGLYVEQLCVNDGCKKCLCLVPLRGSSCV